MLSLSKSFTFLLSASATLHSASAFAPRALSTTSTTTLAMSTSDSSSDRYTIPDQPARFARAKEEKNERYLDIETVYNPAYLKGKRVAITGANRGIGLALAKELVAQGGKLIAICRSSSEELEALHPDEIVTGIEVTSDEACSTIAGKITGGAIDILVNNAGLITKLAAEDEDEDFTSWMDTIQVNLNAPYQLSTLAHKRMKKQENGGVIINNSSIHGSISVEWMTAYASSKAAMDRMTAGLALEWARDKVRVNAVAPGIVPVERTKKK
eukprot:906727_1